MITRPMKPAILDSIDQVKSYPVIVQPKLDGVRCMIVDTVPLTASWKFIPNYYIRNTLMKCFQDWEYHVIDGEILCGKNIQETVSAVMSREGEPKFEYIIFDAVDKPYNQYKRYTERKERLYEKANQCDRSIYKWCYFLRDHIVTNHIDLAGALARNLELGYEGSIIRSPNAPYKSGRSTLKEGYLLKCKPFKDSEAQVVGFLEQLDNHNPASTNELGYVERSSCQDSLFPSGTLGALEVEDVQTGIAFKIGTGFTGKQRQEIWDNKKYYINKILTYKYQEYGTKDKPRIPVFKCWRDERDMERKTS